MFKKALLLTLTTYTISQTGLAQPLEPAFVAKGSFYMYWGYNRSWFSKSDISFSSDYANFTLQDVVANDRQSPLSFEDYVLNPTIPQFNIRWGYAIKDNFTLSFGYDHMKYVVERNQVVKINGTIANTIETVNYAGTYDNSSIALTPDFLRYEHTNGLNYMSTDADLYFSVWRSMNKKCHLALTPGFSMGILYPRSDVDVFDVEGVNVFHLAGWGTALTGGIRLNVGKYFFVQWFNRGGYISLPDVLCRLNNFKAKQNFWYLETAGVIGFTIGPFKSKKAKAE